MSTVAHRPLVYYSFSNFQISKIFITLFSGTKSLQSWNLVHTWTVGWCIIYTGTRLLLLFISLIRQFSFSPIIQFQNIKNFDSLFLLGTVRPTKLKLDIHLGNWLVYYIYQNQAAITYSFVCFCIFLFPISKHLQVLSAKLVQLIYKGYSWGVFMSFCSLSAIFSGLLPEFYDPTGQILPSSGRTTNLPVCYWEIISKIPTETKST